jgi:phenylacetate-CoA ligase
MSHVASQCGFHDSLHVTEENVLVEIQKDGEKAACGEEGTVLLTNLDNFAMPFIRYDVGDRGRILDDECSCGRELSLFRPIGRTREYFVHSDGTFTIFRDVNTVFENVPLEDFQIVQSSLDEIVIRIVRRSDYTESHSQFILNNISPGISAVARIRIELVDSLPYTSSGKIQHIISKIPTKYT